MIFEHQLQKKRGRRPPHTLSTRDKEDAEENFPYSLIWS